MPVKDIKAIIEAERSSLPTYGKKIIKRKRLGVRESFIDGEQVVLIPLTQGKWATIDPEDLPEVIKHKWSYTEIGYACIGVQQSSGKYKRVYMHRLILDPIDGLEVDHVDGDGLNNRRKNLRECTHAENQRNLPKTIRNTSGFKGASWRASQKRFRSRIRINNKEKFLGNHKTAEAAHAAYKDAAKILHGEFARFE